uniref:Uncharacterized protein n=1 Tax=Oryza sativa subsp. japonica TaxID=39947 RepID=Q6UUQ6_ORYSJ|nr:hypothetical protein OSJNBa0079I01.30 [Oryza sativa Japonica Group]
MATEEEAGVEGGGGAARVDGVSGVLAVGDGNRGVDEVGEDVAKPEETTLRRGTPAGKETGAGVLVGINGANLAV